MKRSCQGEDCSEEAKKTCACNRKLQVCARHYQVHKLQGDNHKKLSLKKTLEASNLAYKGYITKLQEIKSICIVKQQKFGKTMKEYLKNIIESMDGRINSANQKMKLGDFEVQDGEANFEVIGEDLEEIMNVLKNYCRIIENGVDELDPMFKISNLQEKFRENILKIEALEIKKAEDSASIDQLLKNIENINEKFFFSEEKNRKQKEQFNSEKLELNKNISEKIEVIAGLKNINPDDIEAVTIKVRNNELQQEINEVKKELLQKNQSIENLQRELEFKKTENENLKIRNNELMKERNENNGDNVLQMKIKSLKDEIDKSKEEKKKLEEDLKAKDAEKKKIELAHKDEKKEIIEEMHKRVKNTEADKEVIKLNSEKRVIEQEIALKEENRKQKEQMMKEFEDMQNKLALKGKDCEELAAKNLEILKEKEISEQQNQAKLAAIAAEKQKFEQIALENGNKAKLLEEKSEEYRLVAQKEKDAISQSLLLEIQKKEEEASEKIRIRESELELKTKEAAENKRILEETLKAKLESEVKIDEITKKAEAEKKNLVEKLKETGQKSKQMKQKYKNDLFEINKKTEELDLKFKEQSKVLIEDKNKIKELDESVAAAHKKAEDQKRKDALEKIILQNQMADMQRKLCEESKTDTLYIEECDFLPYTETGGDRKMKTINLNTFKSVDIKFATGQSFHHTGMICKVSSGTFLYYGGYCSCSGFSISDSDEGYLVDFNNITCTPLPKSNLGINGGCCVSKNNFFYVFAKDANKCAKFSLADNIWSNISRILTTSNDNMSSLVENKILIVTESSQSLIQYDEITDRYIELQNLAKARCLKIICEKWIIIQGERIIFEIVADQLLKYELTTAVVYTGKTLQNHFAYQRKSFIYFMESKHLWRFNINERYLETLTFN